MTLPLPGVEGRAAEAPGEPPPRLRVETISFAASIGGMGRSVEAGQIDIQRVEQNFVIPVQAGIHNHWHFSLIRKVGA